MTRPPISHDIRLTDTTLRDGSHAMSHQFTVEQVRDTVGALDAAGVEVIEVAHGDGLGGSSFNYGFSRTEEIELIATARAAASRARIAVLLVPGIGTVKDLRRAHDAGADIVRIATHCTEADVSVQHFTVARELGMETVGFLMMAHRTSPQELARQARIMVDAGCQCAYVTDSAGALLMHEASARFDALIDELGDDAWVGYHGHQNLSLGIANSVLAVSAGVKQIDGSLCALGAGSGNSPTEVLAAVFDRMGVDAGREHGGLARRRRGGRAALPAALAEDGPQRHRAGLGRGLLQFSASRRTRGGALWCCGPRHPASLRRVGTRRRSGRHDHRHRHRDGTPANVGVRLGPSPLQVDDEPIG